MATAWPPSWAILTKIFSFFCIWAISKALPDKNTWGAPLALFKTSTSCHFIPALLPVCNTLSTASLAANLPAMRSACLCSVPIWHCSSSRGLKIFAFALGLKFCNLDIEIMSIPKAVHIFNSASISSARDWERLFLRPEIQGLLQKYKSSPPDALTLAQKLKSSFSVEQRHFIGEWLQIQPKAQQKFGSDKLWLCDTFAYEQSTGATLSRWKSQIWPGGIKLADLCCGMGGDSIFLDPKVQVLGVDLDPKRLYMFAYNTESAGLKRSAEVKRSFICADVLSSAWKADFLQIDPARRQERRQNQRKFILQPSWNEILDLCKRVQGAVIKLPPGFPVEKIPPTASILYLGHHNDCLEALVLIGEIPWLRNLSQEAIIGAVNCSDDGLFWRSRRELVQNSIKKVKKWLYEPIPTMIRSHLFLNLAKELGLAQIDPQIAYLTGDFPVNSPWLKAFEVLESGTQNRKNIQKWIYKHNIGKLIIKKCGVDINIDAELKKFKLKGDNNGILFFTRLQNKRISILSKTQEIW